MPPDAEPFDEDLPPAFADRWPILNEAAIEALEFAYQAVGEAEQSLMAEAEAMAQRYAEAAKYQPGTQDAALAKVTLDDQAAYRAKRAGLLIAISLATSQAVSAIAAVETLAAAIPAEDPEG